MNTAIMLSEKLANGTFRAARLPDVSACGFTSMICSSDLHHPWLEHEQPSSNSPYFEHSHPLFQ